MPFKRSNCLVLFFISIVSSSSLFAWQHLDASIDISCQQTAETLECQYRSLNNEPLKSIKAYNAKQPLPVAKQESRQPETAILFVVDTSDPGRQNVVDKNKTHITRLLKSLTPEYKIGLASFDKTFRIESAMGASSFILNKQLQQLRAMGKTTELYRSLLEAIKYLHSIDAEQKLIVLFSDGQAEDKAYFHNDVVKAARKSGVVINSIGYPRNVALSVALQTIRRISEETGGEYIEASSSYVLPDSYFLDPFANIKHTGKFRVSLDELDSSPKSIKLALVNAKKTIALNVPITISRTPIQAKKIAPQTTTPATVVAKSNNPTPQVPVQIITRQTETQPINLWIWYGIPAAFIIIIVLILITLFLLWQRPSVKDPKENKEEYKPYAYLISQDDASKRYPITRTIWRIGRGKDNELSINDNSISRKHAEIHRDNDGTFNIRDMNSMNGLYINNNKVGKASLQEGDVIEIGDIFLTFTQYAPEYSLEESTVMQKTKTPLIS